jgi:hypothetical protein
MHDVSHASSSGKDLVKDPCSATQVQSSEPGELCSEFGRAAQVPTVSVLGLGRFVGFGGSYAQSRSVYLETQLEHGLARSQRYFLLLQGRHETVERARVVFCCASTSRLLSAMMVIVMEETFR